MKSDAPLSQSVDKSAVRDRFDELVGSVVEDNVRVAILEAGETVAALVSGDDLDRLRWLDQQDREDWSLLAEIRSGFVGIASEEIEREAERAVAEARAEKKNEKQRATPAR